MKKLKFIILLLSVVFLFAACGETSNVEELVSEDRFEEETAESEEEVDILKQETYTVMIYMVGSDLETEGFAASIDIQEILGSGIDTERTKVLIGTGGASEWALGIPSDKTCIWQMGSMDNEITFMKVWEADALNMGESDTLSFFLNFGYNNFKSDHNALICWNHGGGPVYGYGVDELYGDRLFYNELKKAMENAPFQGENKLDWIGFDACLMASVEIANLFSEFADYLVASEETEPVCGWDYSFLKTLNITSDTVEIAKSIIDTYAAYINANDQNLFYPDVTLSCMDLSKVDKVYDAMDELFAEMEGQLNMAGGYGKLAKLRREVKAFGKVQNPDDCADLVDLGSLAAVMSRDYPVQSSQLLGAIEQLVVYETSNLESATGVSLYYPYDSESGYNVLEMLESQGEVSVEGMYESGMYYKYFENYTNMWICGEPEIDWNNEMAEVIGGLQPGASEALEDELTMQLSQQQLTELSAAYYTILVEGSKAGTYIPVLLSQEIQPDLNGVLHVAMDQEVIVADTGSDETERYWIFREVEQRRDGVLYQSLNTALEGPLGAMAGTEPQWISINLFEDAQTGDIIINSINHVSDEGIQVGKQNVDPQKWDYISYWFGRYIPKYNENQKLLPYSQWDSDGSIWSYNISFDKNLKFKKKSISEIEQNFVVQINVVDVYGNCYASDLVAIQSGEGMVQNYEESTENGIFAWKLYKDHAQLQKYTGSATILKVPKSVQGLPVTVIQGYAFDGNAIEEIIVPDSVTTLYSYAFADCSKLTKVTLSESIMEIPDKAFHHCSSLKEVKLPKNVTSIGQLAFEGCNSLTNFVISEYVQDIAPGAFAGCDYLINLFVDMKNEFFVAKDGVLFTKDMKELVACPSLFKQEYAIPEGVEEIWDFAFAYCYEEQTNLFTHETVGYGLVKIDFPESLKKIGDAAFFECVRLESIELPENVEYIGSLAFGTYDIPLGDTSTQIWESLKIGKQVSWIGLEAFDGYIVQNVEVSEENQYYASENGVLMNKAKTEVLDVFAE